MTGSEGLQPLGEERLKTASRFKLPQHQCHGGINYNRIFQAGLCSQMPFCFDEVSKILSGEDFKEIKIISATGPERWKNRRRGGKR